MRELTAVEVDQVDGGMSDFTAGGMTVIGLGYTLRSKNPGFGRGFFVATTVVATDQIR